MNRHRPILHLTVEGRGIYYWKRAPCARILWPFAVGCCLQASLAFDLETWLTVACLLLALLLLCRRIDSWFMYRWRFLPGLLLQGMLCCAGAVCQYREASRLLPAAPSQDQPAPVILALVETLQEKKNSHATLAKAYRVDKGRRLALPGHCLVYFRKTTRKPELAPGDMIYIYQQPQPIRGPLNPGEVDFRAIRARQGIFRQVFLQDNTYCRLPTREISRLQASLLQSRQRVLDILRTHIRDTASLGLAEAILVGYRSDLQEDIAAAYARTGVMHVIAISGMHLSLIFSIMLAVFRLVPVYGRNPWLSLIIALPAIWWFSLMTGASASVMRSALMSSLPVLGAVLHRRTEGLNVLAASALLLLACRPGWLWDTGFQLSYAAVLGIMLYQKKIQALLPLRHPAATALWSLVSVTLAAQVLTTPLVIFYFRQFPLFFLFSNLVAVPLSSIILLATLLLCGISWMPQLAARAGGLAETLISMLNAFIRRMDGLPYSVLQHLYIDVPLLCLCFGIIASLHGWIASRNKAWLRLCLSLAILAAGWQGYRNIGFSGQSRVMIMQVDGQTTLLQLAGRRARQYILPSASGVPARTWQVLSQARQYYRIRGYGTALLEPGRWQVLTCAGKHILVVSGKAMLTAWNDRPVPDLVLLTGNSPVSLEACFRITGCKRFVADGSNALWKIQQWRKEAEKLPLRLHSTPQQGAFLLD